MSKVLFVYPNKEGYPIIPMGICVLSSLLKKDHHQVDVFDITFMVEKHLDHEARERTKSVKVVDVSKYWGEFKQVNILAEFEKKVREFKPNLIAFSVVENNFFWYKRLLTVLKEKFKIPIVVGGLFPTVRPDLFLDDADYVCLGDGEYPLMELVHRLDNNLNPEGILSIVTKNSPVTMYNKYYNWEYKVFPDWDLFDERHFIKPFMGKMWKTGFFELSRGCPFNCSYCLNKFYQNKFECLGPYNRQKPLDFVMDEMEFFKKKYNLELIFFNDENFLTIKRNRLIQFCNEYRHKINLPFFIATRADSLLDEERVRILKQCGCVTVGIGVECGNEEFRKKILNKNILNSTYIKAFNNCHKYDLRTTANIMIGLPFETEENILESIEFCKKLKTQSVGLSIFAPYCGTHLREVCIQNNFMEDKLYEDIAIINDSVIHMPQLSKEKIDEYYHKFLPMVYGE